jgi:hypothetical protein
MPGRLAGGCPTERNRGQACTFMAAFEYTFLDQPLHAMMRFPSDLPFLFKTSPIVLGAITPVSLVAFRITLRVIFAVRSFDMTLTVFLILASILGVVLRLAMIFCPFLTPRFIGNIELCPGSSNL